MTIITSAVRAVELWISVLPFIVVGIFLASIAVEFRVFNRLFPVLAPVLHHAHLTPRSGIAFITAFGSPITAVAMMAEFYNEKKISQKEALLATVATWFPQTIYEAFAYIAPTIVPVLGMVGIAYLSLFVLNGMMVAILMAIAGRVLLTRKDCEFVADSGCEKVIIRTALKRSVNSSLIILKRIVTIALPVSIMAFVLIDLGIFDALPMYLGWMPIPPEALAVIPLGLANPMAAYIACRFDGCGYPGLQARAPDADGGTYPGESSIHPCAQAAVLLRDLWSGDECEGDIGECGVAARIDCTDDSCSGTAFVRCCCIFKPFSVLPRCDL